MTGERHSVPAQELHGFLLGHSRGQLSEQPEDTARRLTGCVFEHHQLLGLVDHPEPISSSDKKIVGVLHQPARAGQLAQGVHEEGGDFHHRSVAIVLPPDDPDPRARADSLLGQDLAKRLGSIAGLAGQAEVLEQVAPHAERSGARHPKALVADHDGRIALGADDQDGLFEPWIEPGQIREVGAVLPVCVDHESVVAPALRPLSKPLEPGRVDRIREPRRRCGHPEIGELDLDQSGARHQ